MRINNSLKEEIHLDPLMNGHEEVDTPEPNPKLDASPEVQEELFKRTMSLQMESTQKHHLQIENEENMFDNYEHIDEGEEDKEDKEEIILESRHYSQGSVKGRNYKILLARDLLDI